jgi:spermidine synthase
LEDIWIYETHTDGYEVRWRITDVLHREATPFQKLAVVETVEWGKALILDGVLQLAEKDEFIYHEMIAHVAMNSHIGPEKVLIIGGGDGGALREVVKHQCIKHVDMVEIDQRVVAVSQQYFPQVASAIDDRRVSLHIADGLEYVRETAEQYDLVIVDSSDPIGPSVQLFSQGFYQDIYNLLKEDGMVVVQSESPVFFAEPFLNCQSNMKAVYPIVEVYLATVPTYVSGPWSFTVGSKKYNPCEIHNASAILSGLKYYNESLHQAAFCLPQFVQEMLNNGG